MATATPRPGSAGRTSDDDLFVLTIIGFLGIGGVAGLAAATRNTTLRWLLEHQILVPTGQAPLLECPGSGGAGLDLPRAALLAAVVLVAGAISISALRRRRRGGDPR